MGEGGNGRRREWEKEVKVDVHSIRIVAFHAILSASRRPESFYTLLTLSQKQGNTEAQRPQSEML
jgi:hypothetical protein